MTHGKDCQLKIVLPASPTVGACQPRMMGHDDRLPAEEQGEKSPQGNVVLKNNSRIMGQLAKLAQRWAPYYLITRRNRFPRRMRHHSYSRSQADELFRKNAANGLDSTDTWRKSVRIEKNFHQSSCSGETLPRPNLRSDRVAFLRHPATSGQPSYGLLLAVSPVHVRRLCLA